MSEARKKLDLAASKNLKKLKNKLRELFQLDRGDLDFGLYRVMAKKRKDVKRFLKHDLLPQVAEALKEIANADIAEWRAQLAEAEKGAKVAGIPREQSPEVTRCENKIAAATKIDRRTEAETYDHLCNFFARYYDEGDFMSLRRYKSAGKEAYLIPYNGEEVKLHWANADQYYIKTADNYASYIFTLRGGSAPHRVRFEIAAADAEKDNIKESSDKKRFFVLAKEFLGEDKRAGDLVIQFAHRPLSDGEKTKYPQGSKRQAAINRDTEQRVMKKLNGGWRNALAAKDPTETDQERSLLGKHLTAYTAKNSFDYFIHKDLGGFLRRELDNYLKSEVVSMDNLELAGDAPFLRTMAQAKAVKKVGGKIIDFLAQLEDFQKQLWLKKKFVLETSYCITLDKVPASLHAQVIGNAAQCAEWKELFGMEKAPGKAGAGAFCKENPYLVVDTRHFAAGFTDELLAGLDGIDAQLDGLLVHGENFQALNLMQARYRGEVKCVHIDPPYNTDSSGFLYKNNYRHSSWLAMMREGIAKTVDCLSDDASFLCHIDENEYERLHLLFDGTGLPNAETVIWDKKNPMMGAKGIAVQHEYIVWRTKHSGSFRLLNRNVHSILDKAQELIDAHGCVNDKVRKDFSLWVGGNKELTGGERAYRYIDDDGKIFQSVALIWPNPNTPSEKFFVPLIHPVTKKPCPVPKRGWSRTPEKMQELLGRNEIVFGSDHAVQPRRKLFLSKDTKRAISTVIQNGKRGRVDVEKLGLQFSYCHPTSLYEELVNAALLNDDGITLDYFAGSGTTGHAVINLNREDGGARKYILVELGHHFKNVLLPRIKKAVYAKDWKDGKPRDQDGISQFVKCIRLESYEDTLDSLRHKPRSKMLEAAENREMLEDYQLRYALGEETAHSVSLLGEDFIDPSAYKLSVVRDGIRRDETADLAETFNFLLGLRVSTRRVLENVLAITGIDGKGENCLVIWRNSRKMSASQLDKWFETHCADLRGGLNRIYVNGEQNLSALKGNGDRWGVEITELVFRRLMFVGAGDA